jgi:APA family basic amino acid/polyamine antiporter
MSRQGLFPRSIGRLHPVTGTPVLGVLVQGGQGIVLLLVLFLGFGGDTRGVLDFLLDGVVFVDWIFYALTGIVALRLGRSRANVIAAAFALAAAVVCIGAIATNPLASLAGLGILALGAGVYVAFRRAG